MAFTQNEIQRIFQVMGYSSLLRQQYPGVMASILSAQAAPDGTQPDNSLEVQIRTWLANIAILEANIMTYSTAAIVGKDTNETTMTPAKAIYLNRCEMQRLCNNIANALLIKIYKKYAW